MKSLRQTLKLIATKYSGTGNSFLFFDARKPGFDLALKARFKNLKRKEIAKILCNTSFGVGADGVVFVENPKPENFKKINPESAAANIHFKWDFYNSDGSTSEMCGNGARCFGAFAKKIGVKGKVVRFLSGAGVIEVQQNKNNDYEVQMPEISSFARLQKVNAKLTYDFVDSGVPHAVVEVPKKMTFAPPPSSDDYKKLTQIVEQIRAQKRFSATGTNVTFVWPTTTDEFKIKALTFERGVTGYTQACGTGAVAAAYALHFLNLNHKITVQMPGGTLVVNLAGACPTLSGGVVEIATLLLN